MGNEVLLLLECHGVQSNVPETSPQTFYTLLSFGVSSPFALFALLCFRAGQQADTARD